MKTEPFWNRDTTLVFMSMLVASYAWIATERLFIGIPVGIAMHALTTLVYEALAYRFGWRHLSYVEDFVLPFLARFFRNAQSA